MKTVNEIVRKALQRYHANKEKLQVKSEKVKH